MLVAEKWRPWRSYGVLYLWMTEGQEVTK